jgi:hypothetical protein
MRRHRTYGPRDDVPLDEPADLAFRGIDMRAPSLVAPGFVASAKNKRLVEGEYHTRRGLFSPVWGRHASVDFPYRASYLRDDDAEWEASYDTTYGVGAYSDPDEVNETWIVRATATALLFFRETEIGRIIRYAEGLTVDGPVQVFQQFNEIIITRGDDATSLRWSGNWTERVQELVPDAVASGYAAVPNASYGLAWRDRTVLLCGKDELVLSRLADSTQYHATDGIFLINRGRGDTLRAAVPLGAENLLVLKSQSLHVLSYVAADLSDARQDLQPVDLQFDSPRTAIAADGRVWWLDRRGVRTARIAAIDSDSKVLLNVEVMSDTIAPLIRRINWRYASAFTAAVTMERIYFAVALDTQTKPQTLLVWNREAGQWESYDQWDTATLVDFNVLGFASAIPWLNEPRFFAVSDAGRIACLEYGLGEDHVGWSSSTPLRAAIADELVSRGFTAGTSDPKKWDRVQLHIDTWNAALALEAVFDGPGESQDLTGITRDRTAYFTEAAAFEPYNADDRFHDPKRQDYSVALGTPPPSPAPVNRTGVSKWVAGSYYEGNAPADEVYFEPNGHNYRSLVGVSEQALEGTEPDLHPEIWTDLGVGSSYPGWSTGVYYAAGERVTHEGHDYEARSNTFGTEGNVPDESPTKWEDLGLNEAAILGALYLHDGVRLEDYQSVVERRDIGRDAVWCQLKISGSQGANKIRSIAFECREGARSNHQHV